MSTIRDFLDIEPLVIAELEADVTAAQEVVSYTGQLDEVIDGKLSKGFPLLTVLYTGETLEAIDSKNFHAVMRFTVGVFCHGMHGQDNVRDGALEIVRAVKTSLINKRLDETLEVVRPDGDIELLYASPRVVAYQIPFVVAMDQAYTQ